jgi:uncharacterized protein with von Willebrand factor type A (vWA) domain
VVDFKGLDHFNSEIDKKAIALGGTDFSKPLGHILEYIRQHKIREMTLLFLTDGQDNYKEETSRISMALKAEIEK